MSRFKLQDLHAKDLHIYVADGPEADEAQLFLKGMLYLEDPAQELLPYLRKFEQELLEHEIKRVMMDLSGLELMSSSSLRILIAFFKDIDQLEPARKYRVHIRYSADRTWQSAQLPMLTTLQPDLITIEAI
ncbi:MAG: hypothetical protein NXI24_07225 [bacterium]|nr:hypothetical protein [bacterium]